jgi:hypothetical protein
MEISLKSIVANGDYVKKINELYSQRKHPPMGSYYRIFQKQVERYLWSREPNEQNQIIGLA